MSDDMASKCCQCSTLAICLVPTDNGGRLHLCLEHAAMLNRIQSDQHKVNMDQQRQRAALVNYYTESAEMSVGLLGIIPRLQMPPEAPVHNHLRINNANIGVVNQGTIGHVENAVGYMRDAGNDTLAMAFEKLSEAVIAASDASDQQKQDIVEILGVLSRDATQPPERQSKGTMRRLLTDVTGMLNAIGSLGTVCSQVLPVIVAAFS